MRTNSRSKEEKYITIGATRFNKNQLEDMHRSSSKGSDMIYLISWQGFRNNFH